MSLGPDVCTRGSPARCLREVRKACELRLCLYKLSKIFGDDVHVTSPTSRRAAFRGSDGVRIGGSQVLPTPVDGAAFSIVEA